MKLKNVLDSLAKVAIDREFVGCLERMYSTELSEKVKKVVSINKDTVFYDDFELLRGLSQDEILEASSDMAVDFVSLGLIPLFDIGDNDYIAYDATAKMWCKFNIVDEIKFCKAQDLNEYLPE